VISFLDEQVHNFSGLFGLAAGRGVDGVTEVFPLAHHGRHGSVLSFLFHDLCQFRILDAVEANLQITLINLI